MITIDAIGKNGESILPDLEGASPAGGQVTSNSRQHVTLRPGAIVRDSGAWAVVLKVRHDGITGLTSWTTIDAAGNVAKHTHPGESSIEVRSDARLSPFTLHKLVPGKGGPDPDAALPLIIQLRTAAATASGMHGPAHAAAFGLFTYAAERLEANPQLQGGMTQHAAALARTYLPA